MMIKKLSGSMNVCIFAAILGVAILLIPGTASADPNDGKCSWFEWLTPCSGDNHDCCGYDKISAGSTSEAGKAGGKAIPTAKHTCTQRVDADFEACSADKTAGPRTCRAWKRKATAFCNELPGTAIVGTVTSAPKRMSVKRMTTASSAKLSEMKTAANKLKSPGATPATECCHNFGCQTTSGAASCKKVIKAFGACASSNGQVTCTDDECHCTSKP